MNLIKTIEGDVTRFEQTIGVLEGKIIGAHAAAVLQVLKNIDAAAKNPVVAGVLASVLPPQLMAHYPQLMALLEKAIATLTDATVIAADVAAATTTEAKLIVFIKDIQATNLLLRSILLRGLCQELLSLLDNKALTDEVYAYYLQAESLLAA